MIFLKKEKVMKRLIYGLFCIIASIVMNSIEANSHTFFVPRQTTTNSIFELGLNNYAWYHNRSADKEYTYGLYATPFFQQSTKGKDRAKYFFPCNKECLTFNEINHDPNAIESLWFGIMSDLNTNLSGTFSMSPRRRAYGSYFNAYFGKEWSNHSLWFNVAFAVMGVDHSLRMCEKVGEEAGPLSDFELGTINEFTSIISALNNSEWDFGKFCCSKLKRSGVDDIQLKLGYDWFFSENADGEGYENHVSPYLVGTIPTGKRQHSNYIFEPLVGSKNGSFGAGLNADYGLHSGDKSALTWLIDFKYRYVFGVDQCRSFDLCKNGDWSRYLLVVPSDQRLDTQQGVNLLTLNTRVTPGSTIDLWTALHWEFSKFDIEVGYNFWWRQKERIDCKNGLASGYGIFDIAEATVVPQSASCANISQGPLAPNQAESDLEFVSITSRDLNFDSAAHPAAFSSTVYLAADHRCKNAKHPIIIGVGGQYEFAHRIAALDQFAIWAKLGITF